MAPRRAFDIHGMTPAEGKRTADKSISITTFKNLHGKRALQPKATTVEQYVKALTPARQRLLAASNPAKPPFVG